MLSYNGRYNKGGTQVRESSIDGRQRVIEAAATMLATQGLRGISIREVIKLAKAPLGSTYHNFPGGKQQIVTEAVLWAGAQASAQLAYCLQKDAKNGVLLFLQQWRKRLTTSDFRLGCPIIAAAIDAPAEPDSEPIQAAVSRVFQDWQQLVAAHLTELGHPAATAGHLALAVIASVEGAVAMCRGHQSMQPLDAIITCIPLWINTTQAPAC